MDKRFIAPIIVTILLIGYFSLWLFGCFIFPNMPTGVKLIGGLIPLALIGVSIFVLIERIKEIRSGEENDISKY